MDRRKRYLRLVVIAILVLVGGIFLVGAGGYIVFVKYPSIGAQGSDELRKVIGDDAVARLESLVFQAQDTLHRLQYHAGAEPQAPWFAAVSGQAGVQENPASQAATALKTAEALGQLLPTPSPQAQGGEALNATPVPGAALNPLETPAPSTAEAVCPLSVPSLGTMKGEGVWVPYLTDGLTGKVAARRTFFQPDSERPYAIVAVVAFHLDTVDVHYVLGSQEPASDVPVYRPGIIPPADMQPSLLLAVFNGGFKARHGHFGVMANGVTLIPPKPDFGTIALFKDGTLRIGAWGTDIVDSPDIVFWRQNGPLLVQNGQINPRIYNQSTQDWGSSVDGSFPVATWRSAMGLSADGKTLYYAAGPSMTLQSLAQALITAGADQAVQLDINNYWVYFGEVTFNQGKPKTVPLFPEWKDNPDRYLHPYIRDFFYITAKH